VPNIKVSAGGRSAIQDANNSTMAEEECFFKGKVPEWCMASIASRNDHSVALVGPKRTYSMMMKSMIDDETCSDVVFVLKNNERIRAMKGLLIGRSNYFRAIMFRSDMRERARKMRSRLETARRKCLC
jgi:hypothetical protein